MIKLDIFADNDPQNPRTEWCNLGTIACKHRRYDLGDERVNSPLQWEREHTPKDFIILPVFLYDHSGLALSTRPFSCPWDSGQVGYIYVSKEKVREDYSAKRIGKKLRERITSYLENEIAVYSAYINGDVYGFTLTDTETGEEIGSCYGFYGTNWEENGLKETIPESVWPQLSEF